MPLMTADDHLNAIEPALAPGGGAGCRDNLLIEQDRDQP